jgi:hypothetical protein
MASEVSMCNLALSHIGLDSIESLTERTKAAQECDRLYDFVLDATLRDHDWGFARKQVVLALLAETRSGWDYVYAYPTDCVAARGIYNPSSSAGTSYDSETDEYKKYGDVSYEIGSNATGSARVVLTNQASAELIYTAKISNANVYDAAFIESFALHLASYLSIPLKRDTKLKQMLLQEYRLKLGQAQEASAGEGHKDPDNSSSFTRCR